MIRAVWLSLLFLSVAALAADQATAILPCKVHQSAKRDTASACRLAVRTPVTLTGETKGRYVGITGGGCEGFVARRCLSMGPALLMNEPVGTPRKPAAALAVPGSSTSGARSDFRMGVNGGAGFLFGSVPYASGASTGFGFGGGVELRYALSNSLTLSFSPGILIQGLSRSIGGSGSITDPSTIAFSQSFTFLTLRTLGIYQLTKDLRNEKFLWSVAGGLEFLVPLAASQTSTYTGTIAFDADPLLFAMLGPSIRYGFSSGWDLDVMLLGTYNVSGTSGSNSIGFRLDIALTKGL